jgi:starch synthase (maltosyl-transferring)
MAQNAIVLQQQSAKKEPLPSRIVSASAPDASGRVVIECVWPEIDVGRTAIKRVTHDWLEVSADIFSDGHAIVAAELLYRASDSTSWRRVPMQKGDNDRWVARFELDRLLPYLYTIEAWRDPYASWADETRKQIEAGRTVAIETIKGLQLIQSIHQTCDDERLMEFSARLSALKKGSRAQAELMLDDDALALISLFVPRWDLSRYPLELEVRVDRAAARFSSWYELFPRSQSGDPRRHGTFEDVMDRLPYVRDLGFDVLYFPPIHPIGTTNRKGRNNALVAEPEDLGSTYAIGAETGGHTSIHPELGSLDDFRRLVSAARAHGIEIALDFAVQCSLDHPWIKEHPEWFESRSDGSIKFSENPPKKYEDIVNIRFDDDAFPAVWYALRQVVLFWLDQGVKIFRVDNPHTKPIPFWKWLIDEVNAIDREVFFLGEEFTRPKMMKKLAKAGFQQSYTYFTWRNTKSEIVSYILELASEMGEYYRPNFFVNTPDINPYYLQTSGRPGFIIRATLAALLSSNWGLYSGFELCEASPLAGREEYLDSEKYEIKARDFDAPGNIKDHIRALNQIRQENPALQDWRNILILNAWNDNIMAFAKLTPARDNCVMALVNLDPHNAQECTYEMPHWEFGLPDHASIKAEDLLLGISFTLHGKTHRIRLDPHEQPVVVWRLIG